MGHLSGGSEPQIRWLSLFPGVGPYCKPHACRSKAGGVQCVTHRGVAWGHAIWWALLKLLNILAQPVGVRVTAAGWVGEAGWTGRAEDGGNR